MIFIKTLVSVLRLFIFFFRFSCASCQIEFQTANVNHRCNQLHYNSIARPIQHTYNHRAYDIHTGFKSANSNGYLLHFFSEHFQSANSLYQASEKNIFIFFLFCLIIFVRVILFKIDLFNSFNKSL